MNILITGSKGFIGKNLVTALSRLEGAKVFEYDLVSPAKLLDNGLVKSEVIFHLAGVNRPDRVEAFREVNTDLTNTICEELKRLSRKPLFVLASSTQAKLDNPYGISKREAEEAVCAFGRETGTPVLIFRLPGVFGKWCRPNYNSVVATFCYNIARDLPITISDPEREIDLVYIDDVIGGFISGIRYQGFEGGSQRIEYPEVKPVYKVSLRKLAELIRSFRESRRTLLIPDMTDDFIRKLYGAYITYLEPDNMDYPLDQKQDNRGSLAELLKSPHFGQMFVSRTLPGITRGNHYHDTKVEKFIVLEGEAIIRFRSVKPGNEREDKKQRVKDDEIVEYRVSGVDFRVVDIPPGCTHSIENVGSSDLVTLFWADEMFDPGKSDTYWEKVTSDR